MNAKPDSKNAHAGCYGEYMDRGRTQTARAKLGENQTQEDSRNHFATTNKKTRLKKIMILG